jgi:hypothetical protein
MSEFKYRIVETCNFGKDYPDESFLPVPPVSSAKAKAIADAINDALPANHSRYWRVVDLGYVLQPGFEP